MTTNSECAINVLKTHREARGWTDQAVTADLLVQLGLDPAAEAKNAVAVVDPSLVTEAEVVAAEAAAKEAVDKARAARDALNAQAEAEAKARADVAADQAQAAKAARVEQKEAPAKAEAGIHDAAGLTANLQTKHAEARATAEGTSKAQKDPPEPETNKRHP
jgi:hypothetical protein